MPSRFVATALVRIQCETADVSVVSLQRDGRDRLCPSEVLQSKDWTPDLPGLLRRRIPPSGRDASA
ncbi:hypothetical protein [Cutibacterium avidum]|uniref:hypothetical protein n=1 Tax=Cutibacterium avidum TaxID=33010 RepID=UPI001ED9079D|nr:hypothetical protein [Cutibacterium avidum]